MKTFAERLHEIKNGTRQETYITQLRRAGEGAVILEDGEMVVDKDGLPIYPVKYNPAVANRMFNIDLANGPDKQVEARFDGKTFTILDNEHSVSVEIDTSTEEAKEAVEELEEIFEDKDETNG